jgi:hypothetical protein
MEGAQEAQFIGGHLRFSTLKEGISGNKSEVV